MVERGCGGKNLSSGWSGRASLRRWCKNWSSQPGEHLGVQPADDGAAAWTPMHLILKLLPGPLHAACALWSLWVKFRKRETGQLCAAGGNDLGHVCMGGTDCGGRQNIFLKRHFLCWNHFRHRKIALHPASPNADTLYNRSAMIEIRKLTLICY